MNPGLGSYEPSYLEAYHSGDLASRAEESRQALEHCLICPRRCGVNRLAGETGICSTGRTAMVSSYHPHYGEESPLVGSHGSGTVFFTWCSLLCNFCQNYDISHLGHGVSLEAGELARCMLELQTRGCHNINFVTPTHVVPQILEALLLAIPAGLRLPLVYNSGGYDLVSSLRWLEGVVDIYMPDFKCWDPEVAGRFCDARDYPEIAREALREMHRQVGVLVIDGQGVARRGVLLRHLVMPNGLAGTREVMTFVAGELSPDTYVNIMAQYRPCFKAGEEIFRGIKRTEFDQAVDEAREAGIHRIDRPGFF